MARFFIDRPIFAWVISIFIMGVGILSILTLPVAQYPQIAPPSVSVQASYPGASAQTVANTVTQVIEQHRCGYRAGSGSEQAVAGFGVASRSGPETGDHGSKVVGRVFDGDRADRQEWAV